MSYQTKEAWNKIKKIEDDGKITFKQERQRIRQILISLYPSDQQELLSRAPHLRQHMMQPNNAHPYGMQQMFG